MIKGILLFIAVVIVTEIKAQNVGIGTTSPTTQLHTTGGVRFQGLEGNGNRMVSVDANGNLMTSISGGKNDSTAIMNYSTCSGYLKRYISISGLPDTIMSSHISVVLNISMNGGGTLGQFDVRLEAPNGERIILFNSGDTYGTRMENAVFTDVAAVNVYFAEEPYTSYIQPAGYDAGYCTQFPDSGPGFSSLGGGQINPNGKWKLIIQSDDNFGSAPGTFHSWAINFSPLSITSGVDDYIPKWENGNLKGISDIIDKNGKVGIGTNNPITNLQLTGQPVVEIGLENLSGTGRFWSLQSNHLSTGLTTTFQIVDRTATLSRFGIDNDGNVGIGAVQPLQKLHVNGNVYVSSKLGIGTSTPVNSLSVRSTTTNVADFQSTGLATKILLSNANKFSQWGVDANYSYINREATIPFSIQCDGIDQIYVLSNGNTGIGTTSPTNKLHVNGTTRFDGNSSITGNSTISGNLGIGIVVPNAKLDVVGDVKVSSQAIINGNVGIGVPVPTVKLDVAGDAKISGNSFINGNVGIGVPVPTVKLDVAGDSKITGNSTTTGNQTVNGNLGIGVPVPTKRIQISGSGDQEITMLSTDTGGHTWSLQSNGSAATSTFQIIDRSVNQSRIGIDNNGRVGISTNTPSATLDVNGSIRTAYSGSVVVTLGAGLQTVPLSIPSLPAGWNFVNTALVLTNVDGAEGIIRQAKLTSEINIQLRYEALVPGAVRFNYVVFKL